jgi:D-psicose/D-tagatose/L-ribulose 3-epimerase
MKPAVSNLAWVGSDSRPYYQLLAGLDVVAVEVAPTVLLGEEFDVNAPRDVDAARQALADFGLSVSGLQSLYYRHPEFQFADGPLVASSLTAYSDRLVDLCCELGGRYLLVGAPANRRLSGLAPSDAKKRAAETLHRIGDYARACGVWFTVEALDSRFGCELGCTLAEIARLIEMADSDGVRPHLDTGTTDPGAENPFVPADFGSAQVSRRADVEIVDDRDQRRWAGFLQDDRQAPQWLSLELPPSSALTPEENAERIAEGLRQMREVYQCG